jgi:hypothetical protein
VKNYYQEFLKIKKAAKGIKNLRKIANVASEAETNLRVAGVSQKINSKIFCFKKAKTD